MMREIPLLIVLFLIGCSAIPSSAERLASADAFAAAAGFERASFGRVFPLRSYTRFLDSGERKIRLYIEGDGFAYVTRSVPSPDPTPTDPVALRLAVADESPAVVYMARPCQYIFPDSGQCDRRYWTSERYSHEVVRIFGNAIDDLKTTHGIDEIEIVGFSGGATIAAALAAKRHDIFSLRTVAGNLEINAFVAHHRISDMPASVDPAEISLALKDLPQLHVVGGRDNIVPESIAASFLSRQRLKTPRAQKRIHLIPQLDHFGRWDEYWPEILRVPIE